MSAVESFAKMCEADREAQLRENADLEAHPSRESRITENIPPRLTAIVRYLIEDPVLIQPTLEWVEIKRSEIARAKLLALYGQERFDQMAQEV